MELSQQHLELVQVALYARNMKYEGCFGFNKSSEQIQEVGSSILPALEYVLREEVMPTCPLDPKAQREAFPGLSNLMVTYFQVAKSGPMDRAARFLSSIRGSVLIEAMRAVGIVWNDTIPEPLLAAIEAVAQNGSPEEREVALWSLDWHHNKPKIEQELAAARNEVGL
jgi:hypothetical protein